MAVGTTIQVLVGGWFGLFIGWVGFVMAAAIQESVIQSLERE